MLLVRRANRIRSVLAFFVVIPGGNLLLSLVLTAAASAQSPLLESKPATPKSKAAVAYLFPEQVSVTAGKPSAVDLHFRVADGLHINSHAPHEEALIPTTLNLPDSSGVRLAQADFPPGVDFAFAINQIGRASCRERV